MKEPENKFNIVFFEDFMNTVRSRGTDNALVQNGKNHSYGDLAKAAAQWQERFSSLNIIQGMVVGLKLGAQHAANHKGFVVGRLLNSYATGLSSRTLNTLACQTSVVTLNWRSPKTGGGHKSNK